MTEQEYYKRLTQRICLAILALLGCLMMLCSCKAQRVATEHIVEVRDSIVERVVLDTITVPVYIEIPAQEVERITKDSTSRLETDYAISVASVDSNGVLYHNLKTKPQVIEQEVAVVQQHTQHEEYHLQNNSEKDTVYVDVPRDYTWWDKTRFYALYALLALLVFIYRKKIYTFLSSFVSLVS